MNRTRASKFTRRNDELAQLMSLATEDVEYFLAELDIVEHRSSDYLCPKCVKFRFCSYAGEYTGEGSHFVCHQCETGKLDAISLYRWLTGSSFTQAREWLQAFVQHLASSNEEQVRAVDFARSSARTPGDGHAYWDVARALVAYASPLNWRFGAGRYLDERGLFALCVDAGVRELGESARAVEMTTGRLLAMVGEDDALASGIWTNKGNGLVGEETVRFPFLRHNVLIPWHEPSGGIGALRRRLSDGQCGRPKYVMPAGSPTPPVPYMHPSDIERWLSGGYSQLVITEGELDALALRAHLAIVGLPSTSLVVACGGTASLSRFHSTGPWAQGTLGKYVVLALDSDEAAYAACKKHEVPLNRVAAEVSRLEPSQMLSGAKDWVNVLC